MTRRGSRDVRSEGQAGPRPSPRSAHRVPCCRGRCRPVRLQPGGPRVAGGAAGADLLPHADRTRGRDPAGEPQLRQRPRAALHPGKTGMQRRLHRDQQERRNDPAERRRATWCPTISHTQESQLTAIDKGKMDGWEKVGGCSERAVLHRLLTVTDPLARGDGPRGRDLRRLLLARHRALVGRAPRLLRADARRVRRQQPRRTPKARRPQAPGWGCDSNLDAKWTDPVTHELLSEPSCIPEPERRRGLPALARPVRARRSPTGWKKRAGRGASTGAVNPAVKAAEGARTNGRSARPSPSACTGPRKTTCTWPRSCSPPRKEGTLPELLDPHAQRGQERDRDRLHEPAQRHLDDHRRQLDRRRGERDPERARRSVDDDLHLLRRLRLLLRPRAAAGRASASGYRW